MNMEQRDGFRWPEGRQCAVSLTYDDAIASHHETVAPLLAARGLSATFYVYPHPGFTERADPWKEVAALGHELGNHTLFHPCRREPEEGFPWLAPHYDLRHYTRQRWLDEMRVANCLLRLLDGQSERTFGNTCCDTTIGLAGHEISLDEPISKLFLAARGPLSETIVMPRSLRYAALGHFGGDQKTADELIRMVELARQQGGWIILMFHGVGPGGHTVFVDREEHARLVEYLSAEAGRIWSASMVKVARYLRQAGYPAAAPPAGR